MRWLIAQASTRWPLIIRWSNSPPTGSVSCILPVEVMLRAGLAGADASVAHHLSRCFQSPEEIRLHLAGPRRLHGGLFPPEHATGAKVPWLSSAGSRMAIAAF